MSATARLLSIDPASGVDPDPDGRGLSVGVGLGSDGETVREGRDVGDGIGVLASGGSDGSERSEGLLRRRIDRRITKIEEGSVSTLYVSQVDRPGPSSSGV